MTLKQAIELRALAGRYLNDREEDQDPLLLTVLGALCNALDRWIAKAESALRRK
jgi:hypothetical protein